MEIIIIMIREGALISFRENDRSTYVTYVERIFNYSRSWRSSSSLNSLSMPIYNTSSLSLSDAILIRFDDGSLVFATITATLFYFGRLTI